MGVLVIVGFPLSGGWSELGVAYTGLLLACSLFSILLLALVTYVLLFSFGQPSPSFEQATWSRGSRVFHRHTTCTGFATSSRPLLFVSCVLRSEVLLIKGGPVTRMSLYICLQAASPSVSVRYRLAGVEGRPVPIVGSTSHSQPLQHTRETRPCDS